MEFRPCIDIHNGKVKQIVGATLRDDEKSPKENFVTDNGADHYAALYGRLGLSGGHVINLNKSGSEYYEASKDQVMRALRAFPGGLMAGGGINAENASEYLDAGACHVIVTSYVFSQGTINKENLERLEKAVGADRIVLDVSCKKAGGKYLVATDRWQKVTDVTVNTDLFDDLGMHCDGFLVHAVDNEGTASGIDEELIGILASCEKKVCYAGGISSYEDIRRIRDIGRSAVDFTVGSRLELFGGDLLVDEILSIVNREK